MQANLRRAKGEMVIERYKPLSYKKHSLMLKKFRPTWLGTPIAGSLVVAIILAFLIHPAWLSLLGATALYVFFACMAISLDIDDKISMAEELAFLRRKRFDVALPASIMIIIEDRQALKDDDLKNKLVEYLDLLRDGGRRSSAVESYLHQLHEVINANLKLELETGSTGLIDEDLLRSKIEVFRAKKEILDSK